MGGRSSRAQSKDLQLVDRPEDVVCSEVEGTHSCVLELKVAPEDVGKVIGKNGKTVSALRTLLTTLAAKEAPETARAALRNRI